MRPHSSKLAKRPVFALALAASAFALASCSDSDGRERELSELDDRLTTDEADPAVNGATQQEILVDPELSSSANKNAVRDPGPAADGAVPTDSGYQGSYVTAEELDRAKLMSAGKPRVVTEEELCEGCSASGDRTGMTLGAKAEQQQASRGKGTCDAKITYGMGWANRLPPEFPVFPRGRVQEAAGVDGGLCDIRVVSFSTSNPMQQVVDYYYTRAKKSGFSAEYVLRQGTHALGGVRDSDDGAYYITFAKRRDGGTNVDIVANNGR